MSAASESSWRRSRPMTFDELMRGCAPDERDALAWHLAMMRARKTWEALRSRPENDEPMMAIPREGWKPEPPHD